MAFDEGPYDVLTGHAGARFRWVDVRRAAERESAPVQGTHFALPLDRLLASDELPCDVEESLAVFGEGLADTAQAVEELRRRGYGHVLNLSGDRFGGYAWLVHVELI
jgi:rhodanese-related sulfurtransferase